MTASILITPDAQQLARLAAMMFVQQAQECVGKNGRFLTALSGGGTPQAMYKLLAQAPLRDQVPWAQTFIFWGDERLVPPDHPESSYGMTANLLLNHVPIPPENIFRALGETGPETAVTDYVQKLAVQKLAAQKLAETETEHPWPIFDLILLGMGSDGHTASLFPGPIPPEETTDPVISVTAHYDGRPAQRISLTPLVVNDARTVFFLVSGESKAPALRAIMEEPYAPEKWPAQRIQPQNGRLFWLVDTNAASQLSK